jgi:multimeric flavodoxin WrbA
MKITVITGSPHRKGTSALLAEQFILGATEAGHEVFRFDAAFEKVAPCLGCGHCGMSVRPCVHRDGMDGLGPKLLEADAVVFVTPLYYFGMSAQLKAVVDRFYAINTRLMGSGKRACLLAAAYDPAEALTDLVSQYRTILAYLKWEDAGMVLAHGCGTRADAERTDFPQAAYRLGASIAE